MCFLVAVVALWLWAAADAVAGDTLRLGRVPGVGERWPAGAVVAEEALADAAPEACFAVCEISDATFERMRGRSWREGCPVGRSGLRYLRLLHRNANGEAQLGEMVVNAAIADAVVGIFRKLFEAGYSIGRMVLIDEYDADDEASMSDNNTSCFNYRTVAGTKATLSKHALGLAIDINPLYNPCVRSRGGSTLVQPANARPFATNRESRGDIPMKIDRSDLAYRLFVQAGFRWGGAWRSLKDYQHFEF